MVSQTLMSPTEVIKYSGVKLPFNPCSFSELYQIEYHQARTCLGIELWEAMIAALADYSSVTEWIQGTTYNQDDLVSFRGLVYIATAVTTDNMPTVAADWDLAPKFAAGDCQDSYNTLYCSFLAPYLAKTVLHQRLPYIKTRIHDIGVLEYGDAISAELRPRRRRVTSGSRERSPETRRYPGVTFNTT